MRKSLTNAEIAAKWAADEADRKRQRAAYAKVKRLEKVASQGGDAAITFNRDGQFDGWLGMTDEFDEPLTQRMLF